MKRALFLVVLGLVLTLAPAARADVPLVDAHEETRSQLLLGGGVLAASAGLLVAWRLRRRGGPRS